MVTGSKVSSLSITNNQTADVNEGDIIEQIGPFLLILQNSRSFSVDTRGGLGLVDRADEYRASASDAWCAERLVQGDRVIVTAYSYEEQATKLSVFALDRETGRLRRDRVFLITFDGYCDADNHAARHRPTSKVLLENSAGIRTSASAIGITEVLL